MRAELRARTEAAVREEGRKAPELEALAVFYSLLEQDMAAVLRARELGVDPRDFARVFVERRDGGVVLHVITSGDEGKAALMKGLDALARVKEFVVEEEKVRRYTAGDLFDRLMRG